MIDKFIKEMIIELNKKENKKRIEDKLLAPMIDFIIQKIKPYIFFTSIFLISITLLILSILYLLVIR